ncbi:hypothetical protein PFICI_09490 [Pestalotiopsis fici W106-1]|uniref:Pyruvate decarboxylase n=1 Tax=Pestalotiopsis fici (strain W106-1 / CGMCC3.15140) TaxID=1229662 RepID=W3X2L3_PESFW|nr:uncharacterized protein PFICI_09490 [Pestalotiopsis fici W106-1]ETS79637.1 hypothetical protein PFICI_09490 [Pestalotiopsis fici W106-1]
MKLAEYLFQRLRQLGVESIHGVPGDYNLSLLDFVEPAGLRWVGNVNELNAAYAADGYARIKGISALITTFGVGELSAINAIAGAYTERAPVIHIVGIPERASHESRLLIHHTFNDGEYQRFAQMHAHATVAQTRLWDAHTSPQQIDNVLRQCLLHSRPVYLEVPVDLVTAIVPADSLQFPLDLLETSLGTREEAVLAEVHDRIRSAKQPLILVDGEVRPMGVVAQVQELVDSTGWPTWTTPFGKGLLNETVPNFHGIYQGTYNQAKVREFHDTADLVLCFGPHWSSSNSYGYSSIPKSEIAIVFTDNAIHLNGHKYRDISVKAVLQHILQSLSQSSAHAYHKYPELPCDYKLPVPDIAETQLLAQDRLWRVLANILRPGDILLGETGTAGYGVRVMPLPKHARVFTPVTWLSIGYMLPAAQGAALAQRELIESSNYFGLTRGRTILIIGDGSFQMTVQELSTIVRHDLNVLIILINNDGYTIERCIHGRKQGYNDVGRWRYLLAPSLFGAPDGTYLGSARTFGELSRVMVDVEARNETGLAMVELFLDREDAPAGPLRHYLEAQRSKEQK